MDAVATPLPALAPAGAHELQRAAGTVPSPRADGGEPQPLLRAAEPGGTMRDAEGSVAAALARRGGGEPLSPEQRRRLAFTIQADLSRVRLHTDAAADRAAAAVAARAFTVGNDIFVAGGQSALAGLAGEQLLAHELAHVAQHQQGRVPSLEGSGLVVSEPDDALEREADALASRHPTTPPVEPPAALAQTIPAPLATPLPPAATLGERLLAPLRGLAARASATRPTLAAPLDAALALTGQGVDALWQRLRAPIERSSVGRAVVAGLEAIAGQAPTPMPAVPGGAGAPLPATTAARLGAVVGADVRHARIHTDPAASTAARQVGARAFTVGSDIYFDADHFAPTTPAGEKLLVHELTHVAQHAEGRLPADGQGTARVSRPDEPHEREAVASEARAQSAPRRDPRSDGPRSDGPRRDARAARPQPGPANRILSRSLLGDVWNATGGRLVDAAVEVGEEALVAIINRVAPGLLDLVHNGPGAVLRPIIEGAFSGFIGTITGGLTLTSLRTFGASVVGALSTIVGALGGDAGCCATVGQWIESLGQTITGFLRSKAVSQVRAAVEKVNKTIEKIVTFLLAPAFEGLKVYLNITFVAPVQGVVALVQAVMAASARAWDWLCGVFPVLRDISKWFEDTAVEIWNRIKENWKSIAASLATVAFTLLQFTPLGPIVDLIAVGIALSAGIRWVWEHRADIRAWVRSLPMVRSAISAVQKVSAFFERIYQFLATHLPQIVAVLDGIATALTGLPLISILAGVFRGMAAIAETVASAVTSAVRTAVGAIKRVCIAIWNHFLEPVLEVGGSLLLAVTNPELIPVIFAGWAWRALPDCLKPYIINFVLDVLIAWLEAVPSLPFFGLLWPLFKAGAVGFMRAVRAYDDEKKIAISNRVARVVSGASPLFLVGFVAGFFKGMFDGIVDPFVMIFQLVRGIFNVFDWLGQVALHWPKYRPILERAVARMRPLAAAIVDKASQAVQQFLSGPSMTLADLVAKLDDLWGWLENKAGELGGFIAGKLLDFFSGNSAEFDLGYGVGWLLGNVVIMVVLSVLSDGAWAAGDATLLAIQKVIQILNWPYEMMGKALGAIGHLLEPLLAPLRALFVALRVAEWPVIRELTALIELLFKELTSLGERVALTIVETAGAGILADLTAKLGSELAERLVLDLGERAAAALVDELGVDAVKALGGVGGVALEQWVARFGADTVRALAGLGEEKIGQLLATMGRGGIERVMGLAGEEGVARLAGLDAAAQRRLLALDDAALTRVLALDEATLGRLMELESPAFSRLLALDQAAMTRFLALDEAGLRRFLALDEAAFARFATLDEAALGRFAALEEAAFARFAALDEATLQKFVNLDQPALSRFGALDEAMFNRFAALDESAIHKLAGVDDAALARLGALDDATLERLLALDAPAFGRLAALDAPTLARFTRLDDAALAKFAGLDEAALRRFAALDDAVIEKFGRLDAAALENFSALDEAALRKFGALDEPMLARFGQIDGPGLQRFAQLNPEGLLKFGALDVPMLRNFAQLDGDALRAFAFYEDAVLRRFGTLPDADLAKFQGFNDALALRDFTTMPDAVLRDLLANHEAADIRLLGDMTPERWAQAHTSASSLDAGGGHSFGKHGAQTTPAQQELRVRTGRAPNGEVSVTPPPEASRFASASTQVEAAQVAERDLYDNMVRTNGRLKKIYSNALPFSGAGYSYRLVPPGVPPPPFVGGEIVEIMCNRIQFAWELNSAGTDYVLITMYPVP